MRDTIYTFTKEDHKYIEELARLRMETKRYSGKEFGNYNNNSDILGAHGEYAFARLFNYPLPISHPVNGGDKHIDFSNDIFTFQVKSTDYINGHFLVNSDRPFTTKIGILMIVDKFSKSWFAGWIGKDKFFRLATYPSWGKTEKELVVSQNLLCKRSWLLWRYS